MEEVNKYLESVVDSYIRRIDNDAKLSGWDENTIPVPEKLSEKELDIWFENNPYKNSFITPNWDQDIMAVVMGKKPCSLTDNDFLPVEKKKFDYYLRYFLTFRYGLLSLIILKKNDPSVIWYRKENWAKAMFLYLYFEKKLPLEFKKLLKNSKLNHILSLSLGYNEMSCAILGTEIAMYSLVDQLKLLEPYKKKAEEELEKDENFKDDTKETIEANIPVYAFSKNREDIFQKMSYTYKRKIYSFCYKKIMETFNNDHVNFVETQENVKKIINYIEDQDKYKYFSRGVDV